MSHLVLKLMEDADVPPESKSYELTMEEIARLCEIYKNMCMEHMGLFRYDYRSKENSPVRR